MWGTGGTNSVSRQTQTSVISMWQSLLLAVKDGKSKKKKGKQRVPTPQTYDAPRDTRQRRTRVGPSCPSPHKATKNTYSSIGFNVFTVAVKIGRKKEIVTLPVCHLPSSTRASTIAFQRKSSTMFGSPSSTLYEYYTGVGVVILSKAVSVTGKSLQLASHGSWNKHCKKCGNFFFWSFLYDVILTFMTHDTQESLKSNA